MRPIAAIVVLALFAGCKKHEVEVASAPPPLPREVPVRPPPPPPLEVVLPPVSPATPGFVDIHFDLDSALLRPDVTDELGENLAAIRARPEVTVRIEGYADERGSDGENLDLGAMRAAAVKGWLVEHGVPEDRLTTVSYGEDRPADPAHDEAAWATNRRAELHPVGATLALGE